MSRTHWISIVAGTLLVSLACGLTIAPTPAKDDADAVSKNKDDKQPAKGAKKPAPKKLETKVFMRKKLAASQDILEGLALEDYDLIEKGAKQLKAMTLAAEFKASNDPHYAQQSADFLKAVAKLEKVAREKKIDAATLGFMETTMKCVECHKFVRTILIAQ